MLAEELGEGGPAFRFKLFFSPLPCGGDPMLLSEGDLRAVESLDLFDIKPVRDL